MAGTKGTIGILTGGGDVPGLNPAIRAVTIRALREGYRVLGIKRGWAGLVDLIPDKEADNSGSVATLTQEVVNRAGRTGGTFLHTSRTRPTHLPKVLVPGHLADRYSDDINDVTPDVLKNLEFLGIDTLIPIGGDDTLSYAMRMHQEGVKVVAIPKTMDNDVPGTDYCIGDDGGRGRPLLHTGARFRYRAATRAAGRGSQPQPQQVRRSARIRRRDDEAPGRDVVRD
jgi:6-phosphofructokinase 1